MKEFKIPEPGDRVTLRSMVEAEPSAVVTAVSADGRWFRYRSGAVDAWAHVEMIVCYIPRSRKEKRRT